MDRKKWRETAVALCPPCDEVDSVKRSTMSDWTCRQCTLVNKDHSMSCRACYTVNSEEAEELNQAEISTVSDWTCQQCTLVNNGHSNRCEACDTLNSNAAIALGNRFSYTKTQTINRTNKADSRHTDFEASNEIRIVLIGRTGSGKSATGNTLTGKKKFQSMVSASSITSKCNRGECIRNGKKIVVVDTPGLFDTGMTNENVTKEIVKCIGMTSPGPHAMVLVVGIGRFTKEEQDTVSHFVDNFGEGILRYMIVLFTRKDELSKQGQDFNSYVRSVPKELKSILQQCDNRCIAFNNDEKGSANEKQVADFFYMVESMLVNNGGACYTNEIYQEAERTIQRRMREQREQLEEKKNKEKEQIEKEITYKYEQKLKKEKSEKSRIEEELKSKEKMEKKLGEEKRLRDNEIDELNQKLQRMTIGGVDAVEERRRMQKLLDTLQQQVNSSEMSGQKIEKERLQRKMDEINRNHQKELDAKDREAERAFKIKDIEYEVQMNTDKLREIQRDNVEDEKAGVLPDIIGGFKKIGSGVVKAGKKLLGLLGF